MSTHFLVVHGDGAARARIAEVFRSKGFTVDEAAGCTAALESYSRTRPDIVISEHTLPDGNGLEFLRWLKTFRSDVPCFILTGAATRELAMQAMKEGAYQALTSQVDTAQLQIAVERALTPPARNLLEPVFLGVSEAIRQLESEARRVLESESPIFIHGETGAGKGVLARWLQQNGSRRHQPMVDLNCATLSRELLESELFGHDRGSFTGAVSTKPGLLEIADRGTVFLDEIGDLDLAVQPKLLKAVEEQRYRRVGDVVDRPVDIRLITATHQDLEELVEQGKFRSDLYYRICILPLYLPPLRERVEDITILARHFIERFCQKLQRPMVSLADDAIELLQQHPWPGNIRELRNAIDRALLRGEETLDRSHFSFLLSPGKKKTPSGQSWDGRSMTLTEAERAFIEEVLHTADGRVDVAAVRLGISKSSLYNKMKKHGLPMPRRTSGSH